jgi:hypothetical protein
MSPLRDLMPLGARFSRVGDGGAHQTRCSEECHDKPYGEQAAADESPIFCFKQSRLPYFCSVNFIAYFKML